MKLEEIKLLDNELVSQEILDELEESEYVRNFETLGASGQYVSATWFDVTLVDGSHIDVFCKY